MKRDTIIKVRISQEDKQQVLDDAAEARMTLSKYVRAKILVGGQVGIITDEDRKILNDIRKMLATTGGNLKRIMFELEKQETDFMTEGMYLRNAQNELGEIKDSIHRVLHYRP